MKENEKIIVCAKCFRVSCWQGISMCDFVPGADTTTTKTRKELIELGVEHIDFINNAEDYYSDYRAL